MHAVQEEAYDDGSVEGDSSSSIGRGPATSDEELANEQEQRDAIIKRENVNVRRAKKVVVCALVACAAAVSSAVYIFAKQTDERNFDVEVSGMFDKRLLSVCDTSSHLSIITVRRLCRKPCRLGPLGSHL